MRAHLRRRHVAGIDRRVAGSEHRQERGLRPLEMEGHLAVAVDAHVADKLVPNPCADSCGICPAPCPAASRRCTSRSLAVNGSPSCHLTPERSLKVSAVLVLSQAQLVASSGRMVSRLALRDVLVVDDEVIENAHGGNVDRERRFLVNGETGRRLAVIELQDTAVFGPRCLRGRDRQKLVRIAVARAAYFVAIGSSPVCAAEPPWLAAAHFLLVIGDNATRYGIADQPRKTRPEHRSGSACLRPACTARWRGTGPPSRGKPERQC